MADTFDTPTEGRRPSRKELREARKAQEAHVVEGNGQPVVPAEPSSPAEPVKPAESAKPAEPSSPAAPTFRQPLRPSEFAAKMAEEAARQDEQTVAGAGETAQASAPSAVSAEEADGRNELTDSWVRPQWPQMTAGGVPPRVTTFAQAPVDEIVRGDGDVVKRRSKFKTALILIVIIALVGVAGYFGITQLKNSFTGNEDYEGSGTTSVVVSIPKGASGKAIAKILKEQGVIGSESAFIDAWNSDSRSQSIQAGFYDLKKEMSSAAALSALLDPASRAEKKITIPEGVNEKQVVERVAATFDKPVAEVEAVLKDPAAIGLPPEAGGNIEGWLSPLTYTFSPNASIADVFKTMIDTRVKELESINLPRDKWQRTLTIASIIEREVNLPEYYGQVARVIENRLADKNTVLGKLQMDSTVMYGLGKRSGVPTSQDLKTDTPYNTYIHPGLPPTPIAMPRLDAIKIAMNPPAGPWLFFVTINLDTGQTVFSTTLEEHNANVAKLREWMAAHGK